MLQNGGKIMYTIVTPTNLIIVEPGLRHGSTIHGSIWMFDVVEAGLRPASTINKSLKLFVL
jgi:hypothetical protein